MQLGGIISQEIMAQLGNFAALPRQDKLRFFYLTFFFIHYPLDRKSEVCLAEEERQNFLAAA